MDFIGDIIEHEVEAPTVPVQREATGFPKRSKDKKESRWKQRQRQDPQRVKVTNENSTEARPKPVSQLSEAEKIHNENLDKIARMTEGEILAEREELLQGLNPNLVKSLLARVEKRQNKIESHDHVHAEGCEHDGWIGGDRNGKASLPSLDAHDVDVALGINNSNIANDIQDEEFRDDKNVDEDDNGTSKKVRFDNVTTVKYEDLDEDQVELDPNGWEDVDDINDMIVPSGSELDQVAHNDYQLVADEDEHEHEHGSGVHFPKPKTEDLDLDDPKFFDKLHEKYYPDLPKETSKLSWMTTPMPTSKPTTYESISDLRFDFKGNLVELSNDEDVEREDAKDDPKDTPTYLGLHHHSENPHLAGYTLTELAHLSRSVLPSQRCVAIQTLGRILHKLGLHKYSVFPDQETQSDGDDSTKEFEEGIKEIMENFEKMIWDLIEQLRIIDTLTEAADESKTRNLSVRNYAIEALWLWRRGKETEKASKR